MKDYNLDSKATNTRKKPDGYCNLLVETSNKGNVKKTQIGEYGIALDRSRKLDNLIIQMAESNPEALAKLILSVRVTVMDESNSSDEMELVLAQYVTTPLGVWLFFSYQTNKPRNCYVR